MTAASEAVSLKHDRTVKMVRIELRIFEFSHNRITRGHSLKLQKKRVSTDLRQHFFSERVINQCNKLNEDAVTAPTLNSFKGRIQSLYNDGSFTRLFKSAWPSGLNQFPGEAQSSKLSGKSRLPLYHVQTCLTFLLLLTTIMLNIAVKMHTFMNNLLLNIMIY